VQIVITTDRYQQIKFTVKRARTSVKPGWRRVPTSWVSRKDGKERLLKCWWYVEIGKWQFGFGRNYSITHAQKSEWNSLSHLFDSRTL
jgi:hypothetical protein